jgi:hypothetical protein
MYSHRHQFISIAKVLSTKLWLIDGVDLYPSILGDIPFLEFLTILHD